MQRGITYRRDVRSRKIAHRKRICKVRDGYDWYEFDGQYSKGKIHCGCKMCKPYKGYYPSSYDERKMEIAKAELHEYSA